MPGKPAPIKKSPIKKAVKKAPEPTPEPEPAPVEAPPAAAAPAEAAPAEPQVNDVCPAPGGEVDPAAAVEEPPAADGSAPGGNMLDKWGLFREVTWLTYMAGFNVTVVNKTKQIGPGL